jgi:hypothetical protein
MLKYPEIIPTLRWVAAIQVFKIKQRLEKKVA